MDELTNFESTLAELKRYLALPIVNDRDRAGIIQGFEFCFEQCWKALQKTAAKQGVQVGSPKMAFTFALNVNLIPATEEPQWLALIRDRNLTSHTYQKAVALEVLGRVSGDYLGMFERLLAALRALT
jgi:nucleotidyltransferase substrate binding protein (TIGR01987 family)